MGKFLLPQILAQVVDARTRFVDNRELLRLKSPHQHVDLCAVLGKIACRLDSRKNVAGVPVAQAHNAFNHVVIGYGDKIHSGTFCGCVCVLRGDIRFPGAYALQEPFGRTLGKARVDMTVGFCHCQPPGGW
jgi:hypothetical protein